MKNRLTYVPFLVPCMTLLCLANGVAAETRVRAKSSSKGSATTSRVSTSALP